MSIHNSLSFIYLCYFLNRELWARFSLQDFLLQHLSCKYVTKLNISLMYTLNTLRRVPGLPACGGRGAAVGGRGITSICPVITG